LSASYMLDFWGQYHDAAQAAEETSAANRFDRDVTALTTLTAVATAYFQVLASQDRIRTANSNVASALRILEAIKQRFKAGTGTDLDVAQQESVLANQRAAIPTLRQTLDQNINALALLVARPPESLKVAGGSMNQLAVPRVTPGLPSELLTQRPDIKRQEAQLASATANVGSARAILSEHSIDRWRRLSKLGAGLADPTPRGILQHGRQHQPADFRRRRDPGKF
jgi:outer membrane protein, multidrug efflux system